MARVISRTGTYAQRIEKFLGLNECKTGDSLLKMGEAAVLENFSISKEYCLQIRPGTHTELTLGTTPVRGVWRGRVGGDEYVLAACGGHIWNITNMSKVDLGAVTDAVTRFFGMNGNVYIMTGTEYMYWDGEGNIKPVVGYIPVVITAAKPEGGGTTLENYNLLSKYRRQRFSADGTATEYHLTEHPISGVSKVEVDGVSVTGFEVTGETGVIKFTTAPKAGQSNVEITYFVADDEHELVFGKIYHEFYNGATDTRVFLYGDGSNIALYNGLDEHGVSRADYFPALNELQVGTANTPITGLVRHYSRMIAYKPDETYKVEYNSQTLADNTVIAGFYVRPINREVGNEAMGQVYLCDNTPVSLCAGAAYLWSMEFSTATVDERNAKLLSDKVESSIHKMDLAKCVVYDNRFDKEFWITYDGVALIYNYAAKVWYKYTNLPVITGFVSIDSELYFTTNDGRIVCVAQRFTSDDGMNIKAYWESGSMDFDYSWKKKWSTEVFVGLRSSGSSGVTVTAKSDVKGEYYSKYLSMNLNGFDNINFGNFSFIFRSYQKAMRARIRVPRFQLYKLVFQSDSASNTTTITDVAIMTRMPRKVR